MLRFTSLPGSVLCSSSGFLFIETHSVLVRVTFALEGSGDSPIGLLRLARSARETKLVRAVVRQGLPCSALRATLLRSEHYRPLLIRYAHQQESSVLLIWGEAPAFASPEAIVITAALRPRILS